MRRSRIADGWWPGCRWLGRDCWDCYRLTHRFYVLTLGVASTWLVGGLQSGPLHLGGACNTRTGVR